MVFDNDCDWKCDNCDAYMNSQPGFSVATGTWRCAECGALNDVSDNNVIDLLGLLKRGITKFTTKALDDPK